jgi:hypothetical protein
MDEDGFDQFVPDELKAWFQSQAIGKHYILVEGKIKSVSLFEWAEWFENFENRKIDRTDLDDGVYVSTVFLGLDHNFSGHDLPILFETMVFGGQYTNKGCRYSTLGEAKNGHWQIVDCIKAGKPPYVSFGERPFIEEFLEMFEEKEDDEDEETK